jgi:transposase
MFNLNTIPNIYLAKDSVDFRKSIDGLVNIIYYEYELDPYSNALFIFCNKARDKLKIIHYDTNGFWLYYKRLDTSRFKWPNLNKTTTINFKQINLLLSGLDMFCDEGFQENHYQV